MVRAERAIHESSMVSDHRLLIVHTNDDLFLIAASIDSYGSNTTGVNIFIFIFIFVLPNVKSTQSTPQCPKLM